MESIVNALNPLSLYLVVNKERSDNPSKPDWAMKSTISATKVALWISSVIPATIKSSREIFKSAPQQGLLVLAFNQPEISAYHNQL
ncbi:hypothetical protein J6590_003864 [Homalodisca vitripennis]|nr:hypothetical protein J6590_003864 [Homalodisca vitripennis]